MELFNEYYNSELQCLLNLFSLKRQFTREEIEREARSANVDTVFGRYDEVLRRWEDDFKLLERTNDGNYRIRSNLYPLVTPLNDIEADVLADIVHSREAEIFLPDELRARFPLPQNNSYSHINRIQTVGKRKTISRNDADKLRLILRAIYEHKRITYHYLDAQAQEKQAKGIPYRLEHSIFDGRWWLISYSEKEERPIKSRLDNLNEIEILDAHQVDEKVIQKSIMDCLEKTPVVLRISGQSRSKVRNVLERCFITFENMQNIMGRMLDESEFELQFSYFRWDKMLVVRKIIMLGEYVRVLEPEGIVNEVVSELRAAIAQGKAT